MKIKNYQKIAADFVQRLNDVRFAGQVIFVVIVLLISWSGVKSIQSNYGLQKQISALKQQNDLAKLQNTNLSLQNQYYQSNQYLEISARQNFGLAAPGESEIVVPKDVALSYTVPVPGESSEKAAGQAPAYQQHVRSWVDFFLHRQAGN
jgi:cell division protein FtsB